MEAAEVLGFRTGQIGLEHQIESEYPTTVRQKKAKSPSYRNLITRVFVQRIQIT